VPYTTAKVDEFETSLAVRAIGLGVSVRRWSGGAKSTPNLLEILKAGVPQKLIYVKDKTDAPGFWGLNQNQLDSLSKSGVPWCVVLLVGSGEAGYILNPTQVTASKSAWSHSGSDYKVHEGSEIGGAYSFSSFAQAFGNILPG
jgi:hypothetical protein